MVISTYHTVTAPVEEQHNELVEWHISDYLLHIKGITVNLKD